MNNAAVHQSDVVASYWDRFVGSYINSPDHWEANRAVEQFQWNFITGDKFVNPIDWFMRKYGPLKTMASICSGSGVLEKYIAENYIAKDGGRLDGYDLSPQSVETARKFCDGLNGIHFHVADINVAEWEPKYLDAAFANGALHHVTRLDHCLGQLAKALKPGGYFYVSDYVGPRRYQWSDIQLRLAREMLDGIPRKFLRRQTVERCDPVALAAMDPSEAVMCDMTLDHIHGHFNIVYRADRGGTLLAPIFGGGCIDPVMFESAEGMEVMTALCRRERELIDTGIVRSDHVTLVCQPR